MSFGQKNGVENTETRDECRGLRAGGRLQELPYWQRQHFGEVLRHYFTTARVKNQLTPFARMFLARALLFVILQHEKKKNEPPAPSGDGSDYGSYELAKIISPRGKSARNEKPPP